MKYTTTPLNPIINVDTSDNMMVRTDSMLT